MEFEPPVRRKRKAKSGGSKSKKPKKKNKAAPVESGVGDVVASFDKDYHSLLSSMPEPLKPTSFRHGQHSYTVFLNSTFCL